MPQYSHKFIHVKFVRNSYEFHVNFVQFANKHSKHTCKHTLHSHGHVIAHAPPFEHLGDRHAGAVFARCRCWAGGGGARGRGSGVYKLKRAPYSPSLASGGAGNPWWRLVATISSMSPLWS